MLKLSYSLVIEATDDPNFFGFYSSDLPGFTGIGHSVEDCLYKAEHGIAEHLEALRDQGLPTPPASPDPTVLIRNEKKRKSA
jgi:predicted RNase H-like HicB family nuclease